MPAPAFAKQIHTYIRTCTCICVHIYNLNKVYFCISPAMLEVAVVLIRALFFALDNSAH